MYVELKTGHDHDGPARVGWVTLSKTGRTLTYRDLTLEKLTDGGSAGNFQDARTGDQYWVSNVKRQRHVRPAAGTGPLEVDEDALEELARLTGKAADAT
jgi:hypothetical protein